VTAVRVLLIVAAVATLASLPCLVFMMLSLCEFSGSARRAVRRGWRRRLGRWGRCRFRDTDLSRRERRRLIRLDKTFAAPPAAEPVGPPIQQIAADLRRLGQQRVGIATRSPVWFAAVEKAYDERLRLACRELSIDEHLDELVGIDREIERVRVEGELQAAGLPLYGCEAPSP
jgi:hypothetical protein